MSDFEKCNGDPDVCDRPACDVCEANYQAVLHFGTLFTSDLADKVTMYAGRIALDGPLRNGAPGVFAALGAVLLRRCGDEMSGRYDARAAYQRWMATAALNGDDARTVLNGDDADAGA